LTIASRPVSRSTTTITSLDDLRAIPWNFAWVQSRYLTVGWYGVGSAIGTSGAQYAQLYRDWPFFRTLVDNCQLEIGRTLIPVARLYGEQEGFPDEWKQVSRQIAGEFETTVQALKDITESPELMANARTVRATIRFRNPLVEPLHRLQVALMKSVDDHAELRPAMVQTIAGIAAAMQSTG